MVWGVLMAPGCRDKVLGWILRRQEAIAEVVGSLRRVQCVPESGEVEILGDGDGCRCRCITVRVGLGLRLDVYIGDVMGYGLMGSGL